MSKSDIKYVVATLLAIGGCLAIASCDDDEKFDPPVLVSSGDCYIFPKTNNAGHDISTIVLNDFLRQHPELQMVSSTTVSINGKDKSLVIFNKVPLPQAPVEK